MKLKELIFILIFSCYCFSQSYSQDDVISKIIEIGKTDNQTMKHLDFLCNRFGGRTHGSDSYDNAAEWCAYKFKEWGMEVVMDEAGQENIGFNRGPWFGRLLSDDGMELHFATPSYTAGTKGVQRALVVIEPKTQAEFDRMKGKLKGAWVLITGTNNGWPVNTTYEGKKRREAAIQKNIEITKENEKIKEENKNLPAEKQKKLIELQDEPALFYEQMKTAGILGVIQSSKLPIRVMSDRMKMDSMNFENLPEICDIKLDEHQYQKIYQMAKERKYFLLEFDIRNYFKLGPVKYHNVIGIIKGTKYPDEYVVLSSHLDAYDVASGGVDDGSGTSAHMEAARLIMAAGGKPDRTILVCLWAGEEFGLLGSQSWVNRNIDKHSKISAVFNRDGGPTPPMGLSVSQAMWEDMEKVCKPVNEINKDFPFTLTKREPSVLPVKPGGSDHSSFEVYGIPALNFDCPDIKGYDFDYYEIWHTERDMYNLSIPEYQEHTAVVTAVIAYGVANLEKLLSREGYFKKEK